MSSNQRPPPVPPQPQRLLAKLQLATAADHRRLLACLRRDGAVRERLVTQRVRI